MKCPAPPSGTREIVHDFNNLLTAIIGAAEAVLDRSGTDPESRADIAHIREGARRGAALIRRLRGEGRDEPALAGLISVNETILATRRLLDHCLGAHAALTLDLMAHDSQVRMEASQLDRVLLNLIANARRAMPGSGMVALGTARRAVIASEARMPDTIPPGDYVVISVADTGIGMEDDQISRIFDAGFSSRPDAGGSGIGLFSVRNIVRQSSGFLAVDSVSGRGTRFEIYLPSVPGAPLSASSRAALLVEDDPFVRQVAERMLRRADWTVVCTGSAAEALEVLDRSACDLMISDIAMPGMDGLALTRLVLTNRPDLPVILTSGYDDAALDDTFKGGKVLFLTKPFGQAELLAAIARIVQR
jgi:two-component system cell cycle sensor histidine kinase/response regulator CckA